MNRHRPITDPEILRFIEKTLASYPADAANASILQNRAYYDAMCAIFRAPRPAGLRVRDALLGGVRCRLYGPDTATEIVLYLHGGGFVLGGLDSHDDVCAEIAVATGSQVVAVDYRLRPEHPAPAQLEDAYAVWRALDKRAVVVGDSAGGNLAAGLCHRIRRLGGTTPLGQVLIYPDLGGDIAALSYVENAEAPLLSTAEVAFYRSLASPEARLDPEQCPLSARDLSGLPRAVIFTADVDPLRDDGLLYAQALKAAGVRTEVQNSAQLVHGWLRARHSSHRAREAFKAIVGAIRASTWPQS
jgi:acetyl esterase